MARVSHEHKNTSLWLYIYSVALNTFDRYECKFDRRDQAK